MNREGSVQSGILAYATEKLNIREGDPLFLLPRLNEKSHLKLAIMKRMPEWWVNSGNELHSMNGMRNSNTTDAPVLETFLF